MLSQGWLLLKKINPERAIFEQVTRVRSQLEKSIRDHLGASANWDAFNSNGHRVAAQAALICGATPHIAHLVAGKGSFATRDAPGTARIHSSSVNFDHSRRSHWYLYHELRTTKVPHLHVTTAASPLELALFCDSSAGISEAEDGSSDSEEVEDEWNDIWNDESYNKEDWLYMTSGFPFRCPLFHSVTASSSYVAF